MSAKLKGVFFFLVFILITLPLFADVLILKNGKKLQGNIVKEDDQVYEFRDSEGILLTVKKSQVDQEATQKLNVDQKKSEPIAEPPTEPNESKSQRASVADLAREARAKKTGSAKVLRKEDLEKMPEVSIIGTEHTEESIQDHTPPPDIHSVDAEAYWKNETRKFADDLHKIRDDVEYFGKECEDLGKQAAYAIVDPSQYMIVNGVLVPISGSGYDSTTIQQAEEACANAEQAKKELQQIEKELEEFQDRARREGALPGWIDPDRL